MNNTLLKIACEQFEQMLSDEATALTLSKTAGFWGNLGHAIAHPIDTYQHGWDQAPRENLVGKGVETIKEKKKEAPPTSPTAPNEQKPLPSDQYE